MTAHLTLFFCLAAMNAVAQGSEKDYVLGKFDPRTDSRFVRLKDEHTLGSARGTYLRKEAYDAFIRMSDAARKDGVKLIIISSTRNFDVQKGIWENKWNGRTVVEGKNLTTVKDPVARAKIILRFSSMPGSSRHHWGTDMDLNSFNNSDFATGAGLKLYQWLQAHGPEFGFCQPYTSKTGGRTGYEEEKWHWSYLPLSRVFLEEYLTLVESRDITGFEGSTTADSVKIIQKYVQGVACH